MKNRKRKLLVTALAFSLVGTTIMPTAATATVTDINGNSDAVDITGQGMNESAADTDEALKSDLNAVSDLVENDSQIRILVKSPDMEDIETEHLLSSYKDVYLLEYDSEDDAKKAYKTLDKSAEAVAYDDNKMRIADGEDIADFTADIMTEETNPLTELGEAVSEIDLTRDGDEPLIALIDTGVSSDVQVKEAVSMLGDDTSDVNGHGTKMAEAILSENPNAQIISIKAMDENGIGATSTVYAAIEYAIEHDVDIINLSIYGNKINANAMVIDAINEAIEKGITVIGAAGNDGADVANYIPGSIEAAYIIGACDADGNILPTSNYGETVDYYLEADSTSIATARATGMFSKTGKIVGKDTNEREDVAGTIDSSQIQDTDEYALSDEPADEFVEYKEEAEEISETQTPSGYGIEVMVLFADIDKEDANIRTVWDEHYEDIITTDETVLPLYDDGTDYYKAYLTGFAVKNKEILDYVITLNNDLAIAYDGAKFDPETGVLAIPKSAYEDKGYLNDIHALDYEPAEGDNLIVNDENMPIQMEIMVQDKLGSDTNLYVSFDNQIDSVNTYEDYLEKVPTYNKTISIPITTPEYANKITLNNLAIYVNGSTEMLDVTNDAEVRYNNETGVLSIAGSPIQIQSVKIVLMEDNGFKIAYDTAYMEGVPIGYSSSQYAIGTIYNVDINSLSIGAMGYSDNSGSDDSCDYIAYGHWVLSYVWDIFKTYACWDHYKNYGNSMKPSNRYSCAFLLWMSCFDRWGLNTTTSSSSSPYVKWATDNWFSYGTGESTRPGYWSDHILPLKCGDEGNARGGSNHPYEYRGKILDKGSDWVIIGFTTDGKWNQKGSGAYKFYVVNPIQPEYATTSAQATAEYSWKHEITPVKVSENGTTTLAGATFNCVVKDHKGNVVDTKTATTGANGKATFSFSRKETETVYSAKYTYCSNYSSLSATQKAEVSKKYYTSKTAAYNAAVAEANQKKTNALNSIKSRTFTTTISETKAPQGYVAGGSKTWSWTLSSPNNIKGTSTPISSQAVFKNTRQYGKITITKKDPVKNIPLKDATFEILAIGPILDNNNNTVYGTESASSTNPVSLGTITTNSSGFATSDSLGRTLWTGKYRIRETDPTAGYLIGRRSDNGKLEKEVDMTLQDKQKVSLVYEQNLFDDEILADIRLIKRKQTGDNSSEPEKNVRFELYKLENGQRELVTRNIVTGEDGVASYGLKADGTNNPDEGLAPGTYELVQYTKIPNYKNVLPQTFMVPDERSLDGKILQFDYNNGVILPTDAEYDENAYTFDLLNEFDKEGLELQKNWQYTEGGKVIESGGEYGAVFEVYEAKEGDIEDRDDVICILRTGRKGNVSTYADEPVVPTVIGVTTIEQELAGATEDELQNGSCQWNPNNDSEIQREFIDEKGDYSLQPNRGYILHQVRPGMNGYGSQNLSLIEDQPFVVETAKVKQMTAVNEEVPIRVHISKTMSTFGNKAPEEGAVFAIVNRANFQRFIETEYSGAENLADAVQAEENAGNTQAHVGILLEDYDKNASTANGAIVAKITTDNDGEGITILRGYTKSRAIEELGIVQIGGTAGYKMQQEVIPLTEEMFTASQERGIDPAKYGTFSTSLNDDFQDYGYINLLKTRQISETKTTAEKGAIFEVRDENGALVTTIVTDENGQGGSGPLNFGTYTVTQTKGFSNNQFVEPFTVTINAKNRQIVQSFDLTNPAKEVEVELVKTDQSGTHPLEGAVYAVYKAGEEESDEGMLYDTITTDANGKANTKLPYGNYYLLEITAPDGFLVNPDKRFFKLNDSTVTVVFSDEANPTYKINEEDKIRYGKLTLDKQGDVLTGTGANSLSYNKTGIPGAVYELTAKEDITLPTGEVIYPAGTVIATATTDENGVTTFERDVTNIEKNLGIFDYTEGKTTDLPLGEYSVRETSTPTGYALDTEVHDVLLEYTPEEVQYPEYHRDPTPTILATGEAVNAKISAMTTPENIVSVVYSETPPNASNMTDAHIVSADSSAFPVYMWVEDDILYYWSLGNPIYANANSNGLFSNFQSCRYMNLSLLNMSRVTSGNYVLEDNPALATILTPSASATGIDLPGIFMDDSGNTYTDMPATSKKLNTTEVIAPVHAKYNSSMQVKDESSDNIIGVMSTRFASLNESVGQKSASYAQEAKENYIEPKESTINEDEKQDLYEYDFSNIEEQKDAVIDLLNGIKDTEEITEEVIDTTSTESFEFRLLSSAIDKNATVLAEYNGVYLLGYDAKEEMENAYEKLSQGGFLVAKDIAIVPAEQSFGLANTSGIEMSVSNNPLKELNDWEKTVWSNFENKGTIALIDTGANVLHQYSVVGEDSTTDKKHGNDMLKYIREEDPNAKVISIQAFDDDVATVSSMYAAIEMAIEKKVSVINISATALSIEQNQLILAEIKKAEEAGITVVGAAGNSHEYAMDYIPGKSEEATIVGSVDENGNITDFSNYGSTVDYYAVSNSTSEAAARVSGILSANNFDKDCLEKAVEKGTLFKDLADPDPFEKKGRTVADKNFRPAWSYANIKVNVNGGTMTYNGSDSYGSYNKQKTNSRWSDSSGYNYFQVSPSGWIRIWYNGQYTWNVDAVDPSYNGDTFDMWNVWYTFRVSRAGYHTNTSTAYMGYTNEARTANPVTLSEDGCSSATLSTHPYLNVNWIPNTVTITSYNANGGTLQSSPFKASWADTWFKLSGSTLTHSASKTGSYTTTTSTINYNNNIDPWDASTMGIVRNGYHYDTADMWKTTSGDTNTSSTITLNNNTNAWTRLGSTSSSNVNYTLYVNWKITNGAIYYNAGTAWLPQNGHVGGTARTDNPNTITGLVTALSHTHFAGKNGTALTSSYNINTTAFDSWNTTTLFNPPAGYHHAPEATQWKVWNNTQSKWCSQTGISAASFNFNTFKNAGTLNWGDTLVFFANWQPNTYKLLYDPNSPQDSTATWYGGVNDYEWMTYGQQIGIDGSARITCPGYRLRGWNTEPDGTGTWYNRRQYYDVSTLTNAAGVTNIDGGTVTIYAIWEPFESEQIPDGVYKIKTNGNTKAFSDADGTIGNSNQLVTGSGTQLYWKPVWDNDRYEFKVSTQPGASSYSYALDHASANPNDGTYIQTYTKNDSQAQRFFLTMIHSSTNPTAVTPNYKINPMLGQLKVVDAGDSNGGVTLQPNGGDSDTSQIFNFEYAIAFNANGGTGTMANQLFLVNETKDLSQNTFTKAGYVFDGWNTKADGTGTAYNNMQEVTNINNPDNYVQTLYAQWSPGYSITFDKNGGTGTMSRQGLVTGIETPLSPNQYERDGYWFAGWNTKPDGTGIAFYDEQPVSEMPTDTGSITLYAQWVDSVTINFDPTTGNGSMDPIVVRTSDPDTTRLPANTFTKTKAKFGSWSGVEDGSVLLIPDQAEYLELKGKISGILSAQHKTAVVSGSSKTSDITLYAQWADPGRQLVQIYAYVAGKEGETLWINGGDNTMEYPLDAFTFVGLYDDGSMDVINIKEEDVIITNNVKADGDARTVSSQSDPLQTTAYAPDDETTGNIIHMHFDFTNSPNFAEQLAVSGNMTADLYTDARNKEAEKIPDKIEKTLDLTDELQLLRIAFQKVDQYNNPLQGAEFTIYNNVEIVSKTGGKIPKDSVIDVQKSGANGVVLFKDLVGRYQTEDPTSTEPMYYIKETKAPEGATKTDAIWYFSGDLSMLQGTSYKYLFYGDPTLDSEMLSEVVPGEAPEEVPEDPENAPIATSILTPINYVKATTGATKKENAAATAQPVDLTVDSQLVATNIMQNKISVQKIWIDGNPNAHHDPITFDMYDNKGNYVLSDELSENNNWKIEYDENVAPAFDAQGEPIAYRIEETSTLQNYEVEVNGNNTSFILSNVHKGETSVEIQKEWDDESNKDGIRPSQIRYALYRTTKGNKDILDPLNLSNEIAESMVYCSDIRNDASVIVDISSDDSGYYKWESLPKTDDFGNRYIYVPVEVPVNISEADLISYPKAIAAKDAVGEGVLTKDTATGYAPSYENEYNKTYTVTNRHTSRPLSLSVKKVWDNSALKEGEIPEITSIDVTLQKTVNGTTTDVRTYTLSDANNWEQTVDDLPAFENGKQVAYKFVEKDFPHKRTNASMSGYESTSKTTGTSTVITNKYVKKEYYGSIDLTKIERIDQDNPSYAADNVAGVENAIFTVYEDTNKDGNFTEGEDLEFGTMSEDGAVVGKYVIKDIELKEGESRTFFVRETKAPVGYALNNNVYKATLTVGAPNATVSDPDTTYVEEIPIFMLPSTGGFGLIFIAISGGVLIVGGIMINRKRPKAKVKAKA